VRTLAPAGPLASRHRERARADRRLGRAGGRVALTAALAVGLLTFLASQRNYGQDGLAVPVLGVCVVLCGALPLAVHAIQSARGERIPWRIPFLPILGLIYGLYYGMPVLFADQLEMNGKPVDTRALCLCLEMALVGWIACLFAFYGFARFIPLGRRLCLEWDPERARRMAPKMIVVGLCVWFVRRAVELPGSLTQLVLFLERMLQAGVGILLILHFRGQLERTWRHALWFVCIPLYLFLQIGIGSVAQLVFAGVFLLMITWACGRRAPWALLIPFGFLAILLRGNAEEFRKRTWWDTEGAQMSSLERSVAFLELLLERFEKNGFEVLGDSAAVVRSRTSHLSLFAHTADLTPDVVPYWGGATYATLPSSFVPRILWPNKPSKLVGQDFGHRYGILSADDFTTAINLPQLVEVFINCGYAGVVLGMAALGLLYRVLYRVLNRSGSGDASILVAAFIFSALINIESDFSLMFGGVIQTVILLVLVLRRACPTTVRARPALTGGGAV